MVDVGRGIDVVADGDLPVLAGVDGTAIEGHGARLLATPDHAGTGFTVASSEIEITDLAIHGFGTAVAIGPGGSNLHDIVVRDLDVVATSFGVSITGSNGPTSAGSIRGVSVLDSSFEGVPGPYGNALGGVRIGGQALTGPGPAAPPAVVEGVVVSGNRFGPGLLEGVEFVAAQAIGGTAAPSEPLVRDLEVRSNSFEDCPDVCVLGYSALAIGGSIAGAASLGIEVSDNRMATRGIGVAMIGGYTLGPGAVDFSSIQAVTVTGNQIGPVDETCAAGVLLAGTFTDFNLGDAQRGTVSDVLVERNELTGCRRGVSLSGGFAWNHAVGATRLSSVRQVTVSRNRISGTETGIEILGAAVRDGRLLGNSPVTGAPGSSLLATNDTSYISVVGNVLEDNGLGVLLAGGSAVDTTGNVVTSNAIRDVTFDGNRFASNTVDCSSVPDHSTTPAAVVGNVVERASCPESAPGPPGPAAPLQVAPLARAGSVPVGGSTLPATGGGAAPAGSLGVLVLAFGVEVLRRSAVARTT